MQNAGTDYTPGVKFEIRQEADDRIVFRGNTTPWQNGKISDLAGDKVWFADFTNLTAAGRYYVYDTKNDVRSFGFIIGPHVYDPVIVDAVRMFYYQRANTPIPEKYGGKWNQTGGHLGPGQDKEALLTVEGKSDGAPRNVTGGCATQATPTNMCPSL